MLLRHTTLRRTRVLLVSSPQWHGRCHASSDTTATAATAEVLRGAQAALAFREAAAGPGRVGGAPRESRQEFDAVLRKHRVRPSLTLPAWFVAGAVCGVAGRLMKAVVRREDCTVRRRATEIVRDVPGMLLDEGIREVLASQGTEEDAESDEVRRVLRMCRDEGSDGMVIDVDEDDEGVEEGVWGERMRQVQHAANLAAGLAFRISKKL